MKHCASLRYIPEIQAAEDFRWHEQRVASSLEEIDVVPLADWSKGRV